tara:strand:- start:3503 stop:6013 length:2511 start_codon:yes stop_codon:yes gene_type:complete
MAVEKRLEESEIQLMDPDTNAQEVEVAIVNPEAVAISTEDGGVIIDFAPEEDDVNSAPDHDSNLAEYMDKDDLRKLSSELVGDFLGDRESRSDWEKTYVEGLDLLGLNIEDRTTPWPGACGVYHPILTEAVIRFQSQAIMEVFPSSGPVKTKILGKMTDKKEKQSHRVRDYMNYLLTERMTEYRPEMEQLLFSLPLAGSAFKKIYYDPSMDRICSSFVPAEDFVVSYGTSDLLSAERYTHVMRKTSNEVRKLQVAGLYRDTEIGNAPSYDTDIQEKYDELEGESSSGSSDSRHQILEMHVDLDLVGYEDTAEDGEFTEVALPYVVTVLRSTNEVLSVRRNWYEDDIKKTKRMHFVHYQYMPGLGFYGFGLIHLIGGIAKSATSLMRQLIDAGTLSNLPGGLKSRGLRIKGDDSPIMPGEFRDVDIAGGAIKDNITFLPYKEPSNVLHQMLGELVDEGRRFASLTDLKLADMKQDAPVGTTLALIERSMKVMTAIQARLHASMKREFVLISSLVRDFGAETNYEYEEDEEAIKVEDFDSRVDIIPVSDPNSSTMSQRIMQYQAALQLSQQAPQMYDLPELHRQMLDVLGIQDADSIIPLSKDASPRDPVSENMDVLNGKPLKAFSYQDHEAHIQIHMNAIQDPKIQQLVGQSPLASTIQSSMAAHIQEHLGFKYRLEIEKELGVELPRESEVLPEEVEVKLSRLVAEASDRLFRKDVMEEQMRENQEKLTDPVFLLQKEELELEKADLERKSQTDTARMVTKMKEAQMRQETELLRMKSQERMEGARLGVQIAQESLASQQGKEQADKKQILDTAKILADVGKNLMGPNNTNRNNSG